MIFAIHSFIKHVFYSVLTHVSESFLIQSILSRLWPTPSTNTLKIEPKTDTQSLKYREDQYVKTRLAIFLRTYEHPGVHFSQNIDPVFYDSAKLGELLRDEDNELEKIWKRRILIEHTPRGNVLMYYDAFKQAFTYYSDQTVIPYYIMNAVAMKYVLVYWCRDFFIDDSVVPKDAISRLVQREDPKKVPSLSKSNPLGSSTHPQKNPFIKAKTYHSTSVKTDANRDLPEKMTNRFLHLGKMVNYSVLQKSKKTNENNGFKTSLLSSNKLSYEEYKRLKANQ